MKRGSYFGTEMDGTWWRRYRSSGFFARGNGDFWMDEDGLHFLRALTRVPLSISWDEIAAVRLGAWHGGRWGFGRPILKVDFGRDGRELTAGFCVSRDWTEMERFVEELTEKLSLR
jgi:hypothetical protein